MVNVFKLNFETNFNDNGISTRKRKIELNSVCPIMRKRESPLL